MAQKGKIDQEEKLKELNFEMALDGLEKSAEALRAEDVPLDHALKSFEEGIAYYKRCDEILNEAKQKIERYKGDE